VPPRPAYIISPARGRGSACRPSLHSRMSPSWIPAQPDDSPTRMLPHPRMPVQPDDSRVGTGRRTGSDPALSMSPGSLRPAQTGPSQAPPRLLLSETTVAPARTGGQ